MSTSQKGVAHRVHQKLIRVLLEGVEEFQSCQWNLLVYLNLFIIIFHIIILHSNHNIHLVQYCGHYFSESDCKPNQKETCCEGESVPIQTNKLRLFI